MAAPEFKAFQRAYVIEPIDSPDKPANVIPCHVLTCGRKYITVQMSDETTRKYSLTDIHRENTDEAGLWAVIEACRKPNSVLATNAKTAAIIASRNNERNDMHTKMTKSVGEKISKLAEADLSALSTDMLNRLDWRLNELLNIIAENEI